MKNVSFFWKERRVRWWVILCLKSKKIYLSIYQMKLWFLNQIPVKCSMNISQSVHFLLSLLFHCAYTYLFNLSTGTIVVIEEKTVLSSGFLFQVESGSWGYGNYVVSFSFLQVICKCIFFPGISLKYQVLLRSWQIQFLLLFYIC